MRPSLSALEESAPFDQHRALASLSVDQRAMLLIGWPENLTLFATIAGEDKYGDPFIHVVADIPGATPVKIDRFARLAQSDLGRPWPSAFVVDRALLRELERSGLETGNPPPPGIEH
jgi:hypothetical protein